MKTCGLHHVTDALILIGGLNWGLVGLGMLLDSPLNVVNSLLGSWPTVEAVVYLLVGLAALSPIVMKLMGKKCCDGSTCGL